VVTGAADPCAGFDQTGVVVLSVPDGRRGRPTKTTVARASATYNR